MVTEFEFSSAGAANLESDVIALASTAQATIPGAWGYLRGLWDAASLLCLPMSRGRHILETLSEVRGACAWVPG